MTDIITLLRRNECGVQVVQGPTPPLITVETGTGETIMGRFFDTLLDNFVMPAVGDVVTLSVTDASKYIAGLNVYIFGAGFFLVTTTSTSANTITLNNLGNPENVAEDQIVNAGVTMIPGYPVPYPINAWPVAVLSSTFTVPVPDGTTTAALSFYSPAWVQVGMWLHVQGAGVFKVTAGPTNTYPNTITVVNMSTLDNVVPGTVLAIGTAVMACPPPQQNTIARVSSLTTPTQNGNTTANLTFAAAVTWPKVGMVLNIIGYGWYLIDSVTSTTVVVVKNPTAYTWNSTAGAVVTASTVVHAAQNAADDIVA